MLWACDVGRKEGLKNLVRFSVADMASIVAVHRTKEISEQSERNLEIGAEAIRLFRGQAPIALVDLMHHYHPTLKFFDFDEHTTAYFHGKL